MPIKRNIARPDAPTGLNAADWSYNTAKFLTERQIKTQAEKIQNEFKEKVRALIEAFGEEDSEGNLRIMLPQEVRDTFPYRSIANIKKKSKGFDSEAADKIIDAKGLRDRCFKMVPVLDEDEIYACLYEELLTPEEIDKIFTTNITWALTPEKK